MNQKVTIAILSSRELHLQYASDERLETSRLKSNPAFASSSMRQVLSCVTTIVTRYKT